MLYKLQGHLHFTFFKSSREMISTHTIYPDLSRASKIETVQNTRSANFFFAFKMLLQLGNQIRTGTGMVTHSESENSKRYWLALKPVLRIQIFHPGSRIQGQSKRFRIPDSDPHQRIYVFLIHQIVSKLLEIWSGMFLPDPDLQHCQKNITNVVN